MDSARFDNANRLWRAGQNEDAAREFQAIADDTDYPDEKAGALINAHKCYCQITSLDRANEVMHQIRTLPVQDKFVRMIVDFGDACMTAQMGELESGLAKFEKVLELNYSELRHPENRSLYEELQERRGFALTSLQRYDEALHIFEEATLFSTDHSDPSLVSFYTGICYQGTSQPKLARESLLRSIKLGLQHDCEAEARYRLGILYFKERAFAQSKYHLEAALQLPESAINRQLRKNLYQQLSRACHYLGQSEEEKHYLALIKSL